MKLKFIILVLLSLGLQFRATAQNVDTYSLCSGESVDLKVTAIYDGSVFEWSVENSGGFEILNEASNVLSVSFETAETITKNYSCKYFLDGVAYDSSYFEVTFNPFNSVEITADNLCQGQLASFSFISDLEVKNQVWQINNEFKSFISNPQYLCENSDDLNVSLQVTNLAGCVSKVENQYEVATDPEVVIEKEAQFTKKYFIEEVDCGNSVSVFMVEGLNENVNIVKWEIISNNNYLLNVIPNNPPEIKDKKFIEDYWLTENSLKVKWQPINTSTNISVILTYNSGNCEYNTTLNTILIDDNSPTEMEVFQKPNSTVLILPSGQTDLNLNFLWGFTDGSGFEKTVQEENNRFFCEFSDLISANQYWVETWYTSNKICRVRNFLSEVKSAAVPAKINIAIYPVPASENLNIDLSNSINGEITLTDLTGVVLRKINVESGVTNFKLNVGDIKPGNYLVSYQTSSGYFIQSKNLVIK